MATSAQAVTISSVADPTGAFTVSGVFWIAAPANNVVPLPSFRSAVPGITSGDLAALRSGQTVEVPFTAPSGFGASGARTYPSATTQAQVDADIQAMLASAQGIVNQGNPGLATAINRAFNGSTWAAYAGIVGTLPIGRDPQIVTELALAIAQGMIPGASSGRAFGYVAAPAASGTRIMATAYSPASPGAAAQRSVSSASASDASAGTGARTVLITYLTTAFVVKTETVTLNGTTAVNTVNTDIAYIESMVVATTGSGLTNAGAISIFNATAGAGGTLGSIAAGDGQTNWAHHYVPAGKTCLVVGINVGATLAAGRGFMSHSGDPSQSTLPVLPLTELFPHLAGQSQAHVLNRALIVPGPDRIFLTDFPNTATASNVASGSFEYLQV